MTKSTVWQAAPVAAAVLLSSGCFSYVPAELGTLPVGEDVRVELTRVGFAELPELPNRSGPSLTGRLVGSDGDQLFLRVAVAVVVEGQMTRTLRQEVAVPARQIVQIERRTFDRFRTVLAIGGGVLGAAALYYSFEKAGLLSPESPTNPGDEEGVFVPIFFFSLAVP